MASPTCSVDSQGTSLCSSPNLRSAWSLQLEASKWTGKRSRRKFGTLQDKSDTELSLQRTTAEQLGPCSCMISQNQVRCARGVALRCTSRFQARLRSTWYLSSSLLSAVLSMMKMGCSLVHRADSNHVNDVCRQFVVSARW